MRLGDLLVQEKSITEDQLGKALDYQKENPEVRIGAAFVRLGMVDMKTLVGTLAEQNSLSAGVETPAKEVAPKVSQAMKLGEVLLKEKAIIPDQLRKAVEYQQGHPDTMFGQSLIDLGFASEETILTALGKQEEASAKISVPREQGKVAMKLGETLLMENSITEEELGRALEYQKGYPGILLGQALTNLGFASKRDISAAMRKMRGGNLAKAA